MAVIDEKYHRYLTDIMAQGYTYEDPNRKGVIRTEIPSLMLRHELKDGFPILSTKKTFFKGAVAELLFFLSGSTDIRDLWKRGANFWDKDWARYREFSEYEAKTVKAGWKTTEYGAGGVLDFDMGRIYPAQYRDFAGRVDQIVKVVNLLKDNPMSTYMVVNAWNPAELEEMALAPCHYGFQVVGRPLTLSERIDYAEVDHPEAGDHSTLDRVGVVKYGFEIHWQQRSTDYFLGTPINIQYYAAMAMLFEQLTGHKALAVVGDLKKVHLYDNQIEAAKELLTRSPTEYGEVNVELSDYLKRVKKEGHYDGSNLDEILGDLQVSDFKLIDYKSFPSLKAEMLTKDS